MKSDQRNSSKGQIKNLAASVQDRLRAIAREKGRDFNAVLLQYFQERFLYRLSISKYQSSFVLKGALLLVAYNIPRLRPTRDIDFLGDGVSNKPDDIRKIMREIGAIENDDAVIFDIKRISTEQITEHADYSGVRVRVEARLGKMRETLLVDVGFGDIIIPGASELEFPVFLNHDKPIVKVYSRESSIAEKFQTLVRLNIISSRMKDIYDILFQADQDTFEMRRLRDAVEATFQKRMTPMEDCAIVFSNDFSAKTEMASQWKAFFNRTNIESIYDFETAMVRLKNFLEPVIDHKLMPTDATWDKKAWKWIAR